MLISSCWILLLYYKSFFILNYSNAASNYIFMYFKFSMIPKISPKKHTENSRTFTYSFSIRLLSNIKQKYVIKKHVSQLSIMIKIKINFKLFKYLTNTLIGIKFLTRTVWIEFVWSILMHNAELNKIRTWFWKLVTLSQEVVNRYRLRRNYFYTVSRKMLLKCWWNITFFLAYHRIKFIKKSTELFYSIPP